MAKNKFYSDYDRSTVITILICMTVIAVGCVLGSTTKVSVASASSKARNTVSLPMPALPMPAP